MAVHEYARDPSALQTVMADCSVIVSPAHAWRAWANDETLTKPAGNAVNMSAVLPVYVPNQIKVYFNILV
jgi:hypothetical protein